VSAAHHGGRATVRGGRGTIALLLGLALAVPTRADAQLSDPCALACGAVLAASSYAVGTATMVAWGRLGGGVAVPQSAAVAWMTGFVATAAGGLALGSDGERQERAIYGSGVGLLAGAAVGLAVGATGGDGDDGRPFAMSLIGAGIGSLIGGVYGALSYEDAGPGASAPLFTIRIPF